MADLVGRCLSLPHRVVRYHSPSNTPGIDNSSAGSTSARFQIGSGGAAPVGPVPKLDFQGRGHTGHCGWELPYINRSLAENRYEYAPVSTESGFPMLSRAAPPARLAPIGSPL